MTGPQLDIRAMWRHGPTPPLLSVATVILIFNQFGLKNMYHNITKGCFPGEPCDKRRNKFDIIQIHDKDVKIK